MVQLYYSIQMYVMNSTVTNLSISQIFTITVKIIHDRRIFIPNICLVYNRYYPLYTIFIYIINPIIYLRYFTIPIFSQKFFFNIRSACFENLNFVRYTSFMISITNNINYAFNFFLNHKLWTFFKS